MQLKEFAEIDRLATAEADKRGVRSRVEAHNAALATAVGVFMLLDVFARLVGAEEDFSALIALALTALSAGVVFLVIRSQEKRWFRRYHVAYREITEERASSMLRPKRSRAGVTLMRAEQHRAAAAQLRKNPSAKAQELALGHEHVAKMQEHRGKRLEDIR